MENLVNLTDAQMAQLAQRIAAMADTPTDAPAPGVRQYVGARYVPLFATPIEWSDTREYEPLTIVLYQGNSYTSRQYVPTGIEVTNEEYWALTGNFNAQVEAYRQEVMAFDERITANAQAISQEVSAREKTDAKVEANTSAITQEVANREQAIIELDGQIANVQGDIIIKRTKPFFLILGDSWTDFAAGYTNWATHLMNITGGSYKSFGKGGATFKQTASNLISDQIAVAKDGITDDELARLACIILVGGINDISNSIDKSNYRASVTSTIRAINATFPQTPVLFAGNICNISLSANVQFNACDFYHEYVTFDAPYNGYILTSQTLPYFWYGHEDAEVFTSDGLHLNSNGAMAWANEIAACLGFGTSKTVSTWKQAGTIESTPIMVQKTGYNLKFISGYFNVTAGQYDGVPQPWFRTAVNCCYGSSYQQTGTLTGLVSTSQVPACTGWFAYNGTNLRIKLNVDTANSAIM